MVDDRKMRGVVEGAPRPIPTEAQLETVGTLKELECRLRGNIWTAKY